MTAPTCVRCGDDGVVPVPDDCSCWHQPCRHADVMPCPVCDGDPAWVPPAEPSPAWVCDDDAAREVAA